MAEPLVYYIRHGQTDWNAELRFQGQRDIPLNDVGRDQARENGRKLAALIGDSADDFVYISSPLARTRETMELVREQLGLSVENFKTDPRLKEINYGELEGTTQPELKVKDRELYYYRNKNAWTFRPKGGESQEDTLVRIAEWHSSLDSQQKYIVTAHGAVGRVLRHHLLGIPTDEAASYSFPQDKFFKFSNGTEELF